MEDFQCKVLAWEDDGIPEALRQVWMTFRAKYWNGKTTVPQKFFSGKYGEPSEQRNGLGGEQAKHWHGKTTVPKKLFGNTEGLQGTVLAWEGYGTREALLQYGGS